MARRNSTLGRSVLDLDIDDSAFHSKMSGAARAAANFTDKAGTNLMKAGKAISGVGDSMTRNLTLPIVAAGGVVAKFALDFDTSLRQVVGLTDVTQDQIAGIREELMKLGPEVGKSPQELAEAFYFVASAGFKADEAMDVLKTSAKAAASGLGDTQTIAKVLGGVINAYGKENITAARAGDILTEAVSQGTAEASGFAAVIGNVVPGAAALGVSFDQVTAAMAGMTLSGVGVEESATSLIQIFSSLQKPTSQAEDALKGIGLSSAELRRQLREEGLLATLRTLEERFAGNEVASAAVFGNIRALRGVTALLGLDSEQLNSVFAKVEDSLGRLDTAYTDTEGPQRELDRSMVKLQATAIEIGTDVLPLVVEVLGDVADAAGGLADWWKTLDKGTKDLIVRSLAFLAVTGPVLMIVGKLTTGVGALFKAIAFLAGAKGIPLLVTKMKLLSLTSLGVVGAVVAAAAAVGMAWADEINTAGELTKRAEALGANFDDLRRKAEKLRDETGVSLAEALNTVITGMEEAGGAAQNLSDTWDDLPSEIELVAQAAELAAEQVPENVAAALEDGAFVVGPAAEVMVDPIDEAMQKAKQDVADAALDLLHTLATTLSSSPQELRDAAQDMIDDILLPFPDAKHKLQILAILARKEWVTGLTSSDSGDRARTAEYLKGQLAEFELLAPGVLASGKGIPPALQAGIDSTLGALTTYLNTTVVGGITDQFELADELDRMGYDGLAAYVRGIETARRDKAQAVIDAAMAATKPLREGGAGLSSGGYSIGSGWMGSIIRGIAGKMGSLDAQMWAVGSRLGHSLPTEGPLQHPEKGGFSIGQAFMKDGLVKAIAASIRALETGVAQVGDALAIVPRIAMPSMPGLAGVGRSGGGMSSGGLSGAPAGGITNNYNLSVNGVPYSFDKRDDFIKALDDLSAFGGDGRLASG